MGRTRCGRDVCRARHNYGNPFLTDGVGLVFISTAIYAGLAGALGAFVLLVVIGTTCREALFLLGGAWWHRSWRTALMVVGLGASTYVVLRVAVGSTGTLNVFRAPRLVEGAIAWGALWLAFPVGLLAIRRSDAMRLLVPALVILGAIAAASSLIATDTGRMVGVLFPFVAIGTGLYVRKVADTSRALAWIFVIAVSAKGPITVANRLFGPGSSVLTSLAFDLAVLLATSLMFLVAMYAMRNSHRLTAVELIPSQ